jgi:hypothetical protein
MFRPVEDGQLQRFWRSRLKEARVRYDLAATRFKTASTEFTNRTNAA